MKVFLSWSGSKSHKIALVLREWIPSVIQSIEPYVSSEDIDKGTRWSTDIAKELQNSTFGILCVTSDNIEAPWLNFEAGALSKTMDKSYVSPFLFDIKKSEVQGPILQFQSTVFEKDDIFKLLKSLNNACATENKLSEKRLKDTFDVWYSKLEIQLNDIKNTECETDVEPRENIEEKREEILEEILELTRINQKLLRNSENNTSEEILNELNKKLEMLIDSEKMQSQRNKSKVNTMFINDLVHSPFVKNNYLSIRLLLSSVKNEIPWLYEVGMESLKMISEVKSVNEKNEILENLLHFMERCLNNLRMYDDNGEMYYLYRQISRELQNLMIAS